ncbi:hypothetical protein [Hydrogenimonas cancrithermarum]|uniref:HTH iclR-type domain-containing protein n=1 Tax=Hydrogenimonas cancrithermarum TaxID=2993563 RepID=A0ABM8FNP0_9BACT|nr:hypothetical protein [Hydrogenimonas cancrithermarum]BDY14023.1 hypothetical protein HCR_23360 [Hydrogenimonas cancrithermarum]
MTSLEKAQEGLKLLKESILEIIAQHPEGIGNSQIAKILHLESDFEGNQSNYLT